jgi:hypothetical protein
MPRRPRKSGPKKGLTGIPQRIHCPATTDSGGGDELEQIQVDHFLQTLADIALAVASRKAASEGGNVE